MILAAILLLVVLILLAILFKSQNNASLSQEEAIAQEVSKIVAKGDFDACNKINNEEYKIICKNNVALELASKELDAKWCLELDDERIGREDCVSSIILQKAVEQDDIDICREAEELGYINSVELCSANFLVTKAIRENKKEYCDGINNETYKDNCEKQVFMASFFKDPINTNCQNLENFGIEQSVCEEYKKTKACDLIDNSLLMINCMIANGE